MDDRVNLKNKIENEEKCGKFLKMKTKRANYKTNSIIDKKKLENVKAIFEKSSETNTKTE